MDTTTRCIRCNRVLTDAASIERGMGRTCYAKARAATAEYKQHQIERAVELTEDGAVVKLRPGVYMVVSFDGQAVHRTTASRCSCPAGVREARCLHTAAVRIADPLASAPAPARPALAMAA